MFVCQQCAATFAEGGFCAHDGSPLKSSANDPLIGSKVGPYKINALIGVGGMGRVYKAVHPKIGSRVAVKVLSHDCALKPDLTARFFDEARAVNVIRHESIVNILDLDYLPDKRPYIVMEFLDGKPLSSFTGLGRPLPIGTILRIFEDVLAALDAAHQQHIVHRDLKPDNIFISPKGRPKVLDFGIAKLASHDSSLQGQTQAGSLLGTPHYMSPEQALSRPVDARADLYSVGIILYECLTGHRPFHSDNLFTLLQQHVSEAPRDPRDLRPEISPGLQAIVLRAMAKDADQRWQRASDFMLALQEEQQGLADSEWAPIAEGGTPSGAIHSPSRPPSVQTGNKAEPMRRSALSGPPPVQVPGRPRSRSLLGPMVALGAVAVAGVVWASQIDNDPTKAEPTIATESPDAATLVVEAVDAVIDAGAPAAVAVQNISDASAVAVVNAPGALDAGSQPPRHTARKPKEAPSTPDVELEAEDAGEAKPRLATTTKAPPKVPRRDSIKTKAPGQFDVSGYIARAQTRARVAFDDAVLVRIDADGVLPNGKANLNLSDDFGVLYRFMSPSRAKRPKDLPLGVDHKPTCIFYVSVSPGETDNYPLEGWDCSKLAPIGRPRCSSKQVWQRAIADGAPKDNAVAELGYRKSSGARKWYFSIKGVFSKTYDDDC